MSLQWGNVTLANYLKFYILVIVNRLITNFIHCLVNKH